jgi:hypothetical protein
MFFLVPQLALLVHDTQAFTASAHIAPAVLLVCTVSVYEGTGRRITTCSGDSKAISEVLCKLIVGLAAVLVLLSARLR